ncbi:MAG: 4Fe-4S binding protein [Deltaproteobacteria bacterium]|jgi:Pyruvate/2-oxoacid:ferredoxin oxidoreductase delta subunit|nr:4Fe-4S binding protein [Deltaproteobacteria bacterium]
MTEQVYKDLLEVMKNRRGPYAGMDIPEFFDFVEFLFTPQEAEVNNALPRKPASAAEIAKEMGRNENEIKEILEGMADKGLCAAFVDNGLQLYQGVPFMPGIFEYLFMPGKETERDKQIARLLHAYKEAYESAKGPTKMTFPTTRVITVDRTIEAGNTIHTYDQVSTYIDKYDSISVATCFCRHAGKLRDEDTHGMPMDVCMMFGKGAEYVADRLGGRKVTREEAKKVLDIAEEAGLVHMSRNTTEDIGFICNCDRWHCEAMESVLKQDKPALFFNSGFQPRFDADLCIACETCIERCPPVALTMGDNDVPEVDLDRCFGCAVCATGCDQDAIVMESKPDFPVPPKDTKELITSIKASYSK